MNKLGALEFISSPAAEEILIDGISHGRTHTITGLQPGPHQITLRANGYALEERRVVIQPGGVTKLPVALRKLLGSIQIIGPDVPREVLIDGTSYGSRLVIDELEPGEHEVRLIPKNETFKERSQKVWVSGGKTSPLPFEAEKATGVLRLRCTPPPDEVLVDANTYGKTIVINELPVGQRSLEIRAKGHRPIVRTVVIAPDETRELEVSLEPLPGAISVTHQGVKDASRAEVFLNDQPYGLSPRRIPDLTPGRYVLKIRVEGRPDYEQEVEVLPSETAEVRALIPEAAKPELGTFSLRVKGGASTYEKHVPYRLDVKVWIDDEVVLDQQGVRDKLHRFPLKPGSHTLTVRPYCSKYPAEFRIEDFKQRFTLTADQEVRLVVFVQANQIRERRIIRIERTRVGAPAASGTGATNPSETATDPM